MWLIDQIAERHMRQAIDRGELDDLPGAGKPIVLDNDRMVPEELRSGYRLLKNTGHVPPEVETLREIRDLQALLRQIPDPREREFRIRRLRLLETRLAENHGRMLSTRVRRQYGERLSAVLSGSESETDRKQATHVPR